MADQNRPRHNPQKRHKGNQAAQQPKTELQPKQEEEENEEFKDPQQQPQVPPAATAMADQNKQAIIDTILRDQSRALAPSRYPYRPLTGYLVNSNSKCSCSTTSTHDPGPSSCANNIIDIGSKQQNHYLLERNHFP